MILVVPMLTIAVNVVYNESFGLLYFYLFGIKEKNLYSDLTSQFRLN